MVEVDRGTEGGIQLVEFAVETAPTRRCITRGSGFDREAFDSNHDRAAAITGTVWGASDTVELAVEAAPTSLCAPVGAVLTAKLLIQTTTGQRLLPGLSGAPQTP